MCIRDRAYIGAVLPAFLLLMVDPWRALAFLVFLGILQQIEGNVIYPRVVGTSIGLPGIWVLAAVPVGGGPFGLLGVLLSVPAASVLYTLLKLSLIHIWRGRSPSISPGRPPWAQWPFTSATRVW